MRKKYLLVILIMVLIGIFIVAYQSVHNSRPVAPEHTVASTKHHVLAIDLNKGGKFSSADLVTGKAGVLVVHPKSSESSQPKKDEWFNSLDVLMDFDFHKTKRINEQDEIYHRLGLVFFPDSESRRSFVSLADAGIKEIVFDREVITTLPHSKKQVMHVVAGHVVMKDGTKRQMRAVVVGLAGYQ